MRCSHSMGGTPGDHRLADVASGNRIPRISHRQARTVAELRAAGVGVRRVLMVPDNTLHASDLLDAVLTTLDLDVVLDLVQVANGDPNGGGPATAALAQNIERAHKIGREIIVHTLHEDHGPGIVRLAAEGDYDLVALDASPAAEDTPGPPAWLPFVVSHAPCLVCLLAMPAIPREVVDKTPSTVVATVDKKSTDR